MCVWWNGCMHPVLLFAFDHRQSTIEFMNELEEKEYDSHLFKKNDEICSFWSVIRNEHKFTDVNGSLLDARASVHDIKTYTSTSAAWNQTSTRKIMFIPVHCNVLHTFGQLTFISHTHTHTFQFRLLWPSHWTLGVFATVKLGFDYSSISLCCATITIWLSGLSVNVVSIEWKWDGVAIWFEFCVEVVHVDQIHFIQVTNCSHFSWKLSPFALPFSLSCESLHSCVYVCVTLTP